MTVPTHLSASLTRAERTKLIGILGRLGSDFEGERAAAGLLAVRMIRSAGLTWEDLILPEQPSRRREVDWHEAARRCALQQRWLTDWEARFIDGISRRSALTDRQLQTLFSICEALKTRCAA